MKTIKNMYQTLYSFDNLMAAHKNASKNKRYRDDVLRFTSQLEDNIIQIQNELIWKTYEVGRYREFYVKEPKKRLIMALQYRDRIVQWAIYQLLNEQFDRTYIFDSYACRKGKGTHKAADRLQYWLRQVSRKPGKFYYLKLDVSKYFYRIDHEILVGILERKIKDPDLLWLLRRIINCESQSFGLPLECDVGACGKSERLDDIGLPIGNLTSQMFANLYLNELDQFAKHELEAHFYLRYMDDVVILSDSKQQLHEFKDKIECFLRDSLRLELNNKTTIRPISCGIEFVGFYLFATHKKLKRSSAKRMRRRLKSVRSAYSRGEISGDALRSTEASYSGILKHCNSYGLSRKLSLNEPSKGGSLFFWR